MIWDVSVVSDWLSAGRVVLLAAINYWCSLIAEKSYGSVRPAADPELQGRPGMSFTQCLIMNHNE